MRPTRMPATPPHYEYRDEFGRRRSTTALSEHGPSNGGASKSHPNIISPPPSPQMSRIRTQKSSMSSSFSQRLRSNSGLSLHMNEDALRQYTDYNADGTSRGPLFRPFSWESREGGATSGGGRRSLVSEDHEWRLPIPDVFGVEIFQMVLKDTFAASRLLKFSREAGYGVDMAYLSKTQEYSAVVDHLESVLYTISTNYTAVTTASPVTLPSHISRSLGNDLRYVTGTILPGLEGLFIESRGCVEQRVVRDLYPAFLKHQLALATTTSLASHIRMPEAEYPGLGSAFCITNSEDRDKVKWASNDFAGILGRTPDEVIHGNVAKLQGSKDPESSLRMQHAMSKDQECVELVVSRGKDGEPFWNLIYLCPLPDMAGERRCTLHCYINVSDRIRSSTEVLKLLGRGSLGTEAGSTRSSTGSALSNKSARSSPVTAEGDDEQPASRGEKRGRPSRSRSSRRLFHTFRKAPVPPPQIAHRNSSDSALGGVPGVQFTEPSLPPLTENVAPSSAPGTILTTVYSHILLLKHHPGVKSKLLVAHVSPDALELLNPNISAAAVMEKDVFKVLADEGRSPSVTRSFKSSVRKGVVSIGEKVTTEIVLGEMRSRKGSVISLGRTSDNGKKEGRRGAIHINGFWTPLREEKGVDWVVLVLVPVV